MNRRSRPSRPSSPPMPPSAAAATADAAARQPGASPLCTGSTPNPVEDCGTQVRNRLAAGEVHVGPMPVALLPPGGRLVRQQLAPVAPWLSHCSGCQGPIPRLEAAERSRPAAGGCQGSHAGCVGPLGSPGDWQKGRGVAARCTQANKAGRHRRTTAAAATAAALAPCRPNPSRLFQHSSLLLFSQVGAAVLAELAIFSAPPVWRLFSMSGQGGTFVNPQARHVHCACSHCYQPGQRCNMLTLNTACAQSAVRWQHLLHRCRRPLQLHAPALSLPHRS